ncbi:hypothetical protein CFP56_017012 [Quercus suber]|uniref:Uncharacterized protein n=1 Tax=Quercus suber TaxID=58331 RepID=A0AAW0KMY7_QUESU
MLFYLLRSTGSQFCLTLPCRKLFRIL